VKRFYSPLAPNPIKKSEGQKISVLIPGRLERERVGGELRSMEPAPIITKITHPTQFWEHIRMANESLVGLLKSDVQKWNDYRSIAGEVEIDLSGANLSGADLSRADLSRADLNHANLSGANLNRANLNHAKLIGANLTDANLSGADLRDANLRSANLSGADLSHAILGGADLSYADLRGADLRDANLSGATYTEEQMRLAIR
jgi:uncharacterized protein YjbI with pentapeptide repeats